MVGTPAQTVGGYFLLSLIISSGLNMGINTQAPLASKHVRMPQLIPPT